MDPDKKAEDILFQDEDDIAIDDVDFEIVADDGDMPDLKIVDDDDEQPADNPEPKGDDEPPQEPSESDAEYRRRISESDARAADAEGKLAGVQHELLTAKKNEATWQVNFAEEHEKNLTSEINALNRQLIAAEDEGDSEKRLEIQEQLDAKKKKRDEVSDAKRAVQGQIVEIDKQLDGKAPPAKKDDTASDDRKNQKTLEPEGQEWAARNGWITDPITETEKVKQKYAFRIDKELQRDPKFQLGTRAYYDELDKRIGEAMSEYETPGRKRSNVNPAPGGNGRSKPKSKNKIQLTKEDVSTMRTLGLDPNDKKVLKEYALNKRETDKDSLEEPSAKQPVR